MDKKICYVGALVRWEALDHSSIGPSSRAPTHSVPSSLPPWKRPSKWWVATSMGGSTHRAFLQSKCQRSTPQTFQWEKTSRKEVSFISVFPWFGLAPGWPWSSYQVFPFGQASTEGLGLHQGWSNEPAWSWPPCKFLSKVTVESLCAQHFSGDMLR